MIETIAKTEMNLEGDDETTMIIVMSLDDAASPGMRENQLIWAVATREIADTGTVTYATYPRLRQVHLQEERLSLNFRPSILVDGIQKNVITREMTDQEMNGREMTDQEKRGLGMSDTEICGTNGSVTVIQIDENETELEDTVLKHPSLQPQPLQQQQQ